MSERTALLADENLDGDLIRALRRRVVGVVFERVQDVGLSGSPDTETLAWAAAHGCVVLSHDINTMPTAAFDRMRRGLPVTGLCIIKQTAPISVQIEGAELLVLALDADEWANRVYYVPL